MHWTSGGDDLDAAGDHNTPGGDGGRGCFQSQTKEPIMTKPVVLSRYQRRVLWLFSQGYNVQEVAAEIGTVRQSITDAALVIRRKFGARTSAQAVLMAYIQGHLGVHEDCGTRASYVRHLDAGEDACPACRNANARWLKKQSEPEGYSAPLTDVQVKLIRALYAGRTHRELNLNWHVGRSTLHREVTDMYRRLGVADVPRELRREQAFQEAIRRGVLGPVAPKVPPLDLGPSGLPLTKLEQETLHAVDGRTLTEAGAVLGISRTDVSSRLHLVYTKLGVTHLPRNDKRAAALAEARRRGYAV